MIRRDTSETRRYTNLEFTDNLKFSRRVGKDGGSLLEKALFMNMPALQQGLRL